jgi:filamentous hemagglutinin
MVAAVPALAGLAPDALALALANPAAAVNAGIITVETAAAIATDSMTPGLAIEGLVQKAGNAANNAVKQADLEILAANGVKFTLQNVVATGTTPSGQIVFLETGSSSAGLQHIIEEHGAEFANMGVSPAQIPDVVMQAVTQGKIVGYQGSGTGRPIYEVTVNGQQHQIAVTVGSNGFIVGANPRGSVK